MSTSFTSKWAEETIPIKVSATGKPPIMTWHMNTLDSKGLERTRKEVENTTSHKVPYIYLATWKLVEKPNRLLNTFCARNWNCENWYFFAFLLPIYRCPMKILLSAIFVFTSIIFLIPLVLSNASFWYN
jgi:hypothetical protein